MPAIPFALSIHHFISTVGADAGFAAIIGLAILVLLIFAQARETASLRQRAADAEDQLHRLELYVDQLARRSAPTPAPAPAPALTAGRPGVVSPPAAAGAPAAARGAAVPARASVAAQAVGGVATIPSAPAGTAAPALSAATRLIPAPDPISIRALNHGADAPGDAEVRGATAVVSPASPPPSTAAGGANSANGSSRVAPRLGGPGLGDDPRGPAEPRGAAELPPRMRLNRSEGGAAPMAPRRLGADSAGRSRIGRGAIAVITLLVAALVVVALLVLTGGGGASSQSSSSAAARTTKPASSSAARRRRRGVVAVSPSSVTVAVLNGTSTSNLAHDVMSTLTGLGFKQGPAPATAPDQTHATTIVGYLPGFRTDALAVAKSLKLKSSAVAPIDANDRAVACGTATTTCAAQVVAIVGADLQSAAGTTSGAAGTTGGSTATAPTGT